MQESRVGVLVNSLSQSQQQPPDVQVSFPMISPKAPDIGELETPLTPAVPQIPYHSMHDHTHTHTVMSA